MGGLDAKGAEKELAVSFGFLSVSFPEVEGKCDGIELTLPERDL